MVLQRQVGYDDAAYSMLPDDPETQEFLRDCVETAPIGLHWLAADGTVKWANPAEYEPLGYTADEYIGHNIKEFHADPDVIEDILRRLMAGERLHEYEAKLRCKDGSPRSVLITSSVKFDEAGTFQHTRCFTVDVTVRRPHGAAELQKIETLSREVERLRLLASHERGIVDSILNASPYGIIVSDVQGKLTLQNKEAERIWAGSATAEDVADWGKYRGFHPDGRPYEGSDWAMAQCLMTGETIHPKRERIQRFDGSFAVVLGGSAPIQGSSGEIQGAVAIFADVTRYQEIEDALKLSATRYQTTLKSIGDAVIATDATGRINFMNPVAEALTGWDLASASDKPLAEVFRIYDDKTGKIVERPVDKVIREGKVVDLVSHTILVARDGTRLPIEDSGAPILDDSGTLAGLVLVFRDVTEKRQEENRRAFLAEASSMLASSLDFAQTLSAIAKLAVPAVADWCAVDIAEEDGTVARLAVVHVDPAKLRLLEELEQKYPTDPTSPHGAHEVIRSGTPQIVAEIPDELLVTVAVDDEHLRLIRALGLKSSIVVPLFAHGEIRGALTLVTSESNRTFSPADVEFAQQLANCAALAIGNARQYSTVTRSVDELEEVRNQLEEASRAKDDFLAMLGHELRNPLAPILTALHLMRLRGDGSTEREQAVIARQIDHLVRPVDDLLDVSRITQGKVELARSRMQIADVVVRAVEMASPLIEQKEHQLIVDVPAAGLLVEADSARLSQVVANLLTNAAKYTDKAGTIRIEGSEGAGGSVRLAVKDSGIGIRSEMLHQIFTLFTQEPQALDRSQGGLGLGLAIVKSLVALHDGTIVAQSDGPGQGSTFIMTLPGAQGMRAASTTPIAPLPSAKAPANAARRVLVVDDNQDAADLMAEYFAALGHDARVAYDGPSALEIVAQFQPEVAFLDIGLPAMDGYELARRMRANPTLRATRLIAVTGYGQVSDREISRSAGFHHHVVKPVSMAELTALLVEDCAPASDPCH